MLLWHMPGQYLLIVKWVEKGEIGASFAYVPSYALDCKPVNAMAKRDYDELKISGGWIYMHMGVIQKLRWLI